MIIWPSAAVAARQESDVTFDPFSSGLQDHDRSIYSGERIDDSRRRSSIESERSPQSLSRLLSGRYRQAPKANVG
jgi:hypothetical protein